MFISSREAFIGKKNIPHKPADEWVVAKDFDDYDFKEGFPKVCQADFISLVRRNEKIGLLCILHLKPDVNMSKGDNFRYYYNNQANRYFYLSRDEMQLLEDKGLFRAILTFLENQPSGYEEFEIYEDGTILQ